MLATNVPEGLEAFADTVLVLSRGRQLAFGPIAEILDGGDDLAEAVARRLDDRMITHFLWRDLRDNALAWITLLGLTALAGLLSWAVAADYGLMALG